MMLSGLIFFFKPPLTFAVHIYGVGRLLRFYCKIYSFCPTAQPFATLCTGICALASGAVQALEHSVSLLHQ